MYIKNNRTPSFSFSFSIDSKFWMGDWILSVTHLNLKSIENEKENEKKKLYDL